nr:MAG TPA: chromosome partition protein [Caudoviricetes sp.]
MTSFAGVNIVDVNEEAADYGRWLILGAQGAGKSYDQFRRRQHC